MDIWTLESHRRETLTEAQCAKLLPAIVDEYDTPPVDSILYNRLEDHMPHGRGSRSVIVIGYLKEEFWELEHDDPHKAPRELRIPHVKAEIERLCDEHDVTIFEAIAALRLT